MRQTALEVEMDARKVHVFADRGSKGIDQTEEVRKPTTRNRDHRIRIQYGHIAFRPTESLQVGQIDDVRFMDAEEDLWVQVCFKYADVLAAH